MREQNMRLIGTPNTAVQAGKLESSPMRTADISAVSPEKTPGLRLAEALGVGVNVAGKVFEQLDEQKAAYDTLNAQADALNFSNKVLDEANTKTNEEKLKFYEQKLNEFMGTYSLRQNVSDKSIIAGMSTATAKLAGAQEKVMEDIRKDAVTDLQEKTKQVIQDAITDGGVLLRKDKTEIKKVTSTDILNYLTQDLGLSNKEAGDFYVKTMIARIERHIQDKVNNNEPIEVKSVEIQNMLKWLKIKGTDGVDYATHPEYGPKIIAIEKTLNTAEATQQKALEGRVYMSLYQRIALLNSSNVTELKEARQLINDNTAYLKTTEFEKLHEFVNNVETGKAYVNNLGTYTTAADAILKQQLTKDKVNTDFFIKYGIYNADDRNRLVSLAKNADEKKSEDKYGIWLGLLKSIRPGPFDFNPELSKLVSGAEDLYTKLVIMEGREPNQAYDYVIKHYNLGSYFAKTAGPAGSTVEGPKNTPRLNVQNVTDIIEQINMYGGGK